MPPLQAPFPYFGGKRQIGDYVWQRLGPVQNYVEPFFGSGAVMLMRPDEPGMETVNDADGMVANFWRAVQADPDAVAHHAAWPVFENDLHARHSWLVGKKDSLQSRLEGDPDYYDAKIAGWWLWGICVWIGGEFCSGTGPWQVVDGKLIRTNAGGRGIHRRKIHMNYGRGIHRKHMYPSNGKMAIADWIHGLCDRLRRVRVACGDWSRVCSPAVTVNNGLTGVFLDPPYGHGMGRANSIYTHEADIGGDIRAWCREWGHHPQMRIILCGYGDEHDSLGWERHEWSASGGYGRGENSKALENRHRECLWISPHCIALDERQLNLWEA